MVSTDVQIVMFGGTDSSNAVFRETWVFDGKHWTHRQDIGPLPRFSHAMSYDVARRRIHATLSTLPSRSSVGIIRRISG
jgi:hypothetical protein